MERTFGQLKQRFRELYHIQLRNYHRIVKLIYVCCVLHNLADEDDLKVLEPPENTENNENLAPHPPNHDEVGMFGTAAVRTFRVELYESVFQMHRPRT